MNGVEIPNIDAFDLKAEATMGDGTLLLKFAGNADSRSLPAIEGMLARVHEEALRLALGEVTIDFRACGFVNSSCFKAFIVWLEQIQELEASKQYRLRFFADDTKPWQRRSLGALCCFAVDLVQIESKQRS